MWYIAICDDSKIDQKIAQQAIQQLNKNGTKIEISTFDNGLSLIDAYQRGRNYDIILLDMCMSPLDGIETAKLLRKIDEDVAILIITSSMEYVLKGYEINAVRYITKPFDNQQLGFEIKKILTKRNQTIQEVFTFSEGKGLSKIPLNEIYYFESFAHKVIIHTKNGEYTFNGKISEVAKLLENKGFFTIHKCYVANLKLAKSLKNGTLEFENDLKLYVSKHRLKEVNSKYKSLLIMTR